MNWPCNTNSTALAHRIVNTLSTQRHMRTRAPLSTQRLLHCETLKCTEWMKWVNRWTNSLRNHLTSLPMLTSPLSPLPLLYYRGIINKKKKQHEKENKKPIWESEKSALLSLPLLIRSWAIVELRIWGLDNAMKRISASPTTNAYEHRFIFCMHFRSYCDC